MTSPSDRLDHEPTRPVPPHIPGWLSPGEEARIAERDAPRRLLSRAVVEAVRKYPEADADSAAAYVESVVVELAALLRGGADAPRAEGENAVGLSVICNDCGTLVSGVEAGDRVRWVTCSVCRVRQERALGGVSPRAQTTPDNALAEKINAALDDALAALESVNRIPARLRDLMLTAYPAGSPSPEAPSPKAEAGQTLCKALRLAGERFEDLAEIVERTGSYDNATFLRLSGQRCLRAASGGSFHDDIVMSGSVSSPTSTPKDAT